MTRFIKSVPLALSGVALAFAALGNLLLTYGQALRYICGVVSAVVLALFALKLILDFSQAREDLKSPVALSVLPTSTMALMLLSTYARPFLGAAAVCLWYAAVITHVAIMLVFLKRFVFRLKLESVFPSWFVTYVGIVTASVTAPAIGARPVGQAAFFVGFTLFFAVLALNICRAIKIKQFPQPALPTIAICTAPMSLSTVGYMSSFQQHSEFFVYALLTAAATGYIFVSVMMISKLLKLKFYPSYAAFTFPYVISATAFRLGAAFLAERGLHFFAPAAHISLWIAIAMVLYVSVRYAIYFKGALK